MSKSSYKQISADLLYEGMLVPHDIYDYGLKSVLVSRGSIVDIALLDHLKAYNKRTLYVTEETEDIMRRQGISSSAAAALRALEEKTGYSEVKHEVLDMIEKISSAGITDIRQKDLDPVSRALSQTVDNTEPAVILELVNALAPVDEYLQRHCVDVSLLNGLFGKWLKLPQEAVDTLVLVGLLHDCGKAFIPNKILSSPRGLTGIEFEVIKTHPIFSSTLLTEFPEEVQRAARGHHEKVDGTGYPDGLSEESIPYMSRITAISDIYDAMTARRSYKEPKNPFSTLGMLNSLKGTALDPALVDLFADKIPEELMGRTVLLSNGTVGVIHAFDVNDIEHPSVRIAGSIIKTNNTIYCQSMLLEDMDS